MTRIREEEEVKNHLIFMKFCTQQQILKIELDERHVIKNEKVALDRL